MAKIDTFTAIIIDDEPEDVKILVEHLKPFPFVEVVKFCKNGIEGLKAIRELNPSLVFLDVELPDMKGLELIESIDPELTQKCFFVIYTAFIDYMLESFRNQVFDFLLKPINPDELATIMRRLQTSNMPVMTKTEGNLYKSDQNLLMFINSIDFRMVKMKDIGVFQYNSEKRIWEVVIANTLKPIRLKRNVSNKMLLSLNEKYVQVNQKYIINVDYLFQVTDNICSFYPPFQNIDYVKVGSSFRRQLMDRFMSL